MDGGASGGVVAAMALGNYLGDGYHQSYDTAAAQAARFRAFVRDEMPPECRLGELQG